MQKRKLFFINILIHIKYDETVNNKYTDQQACSSTAANTGRVLSNRYNVADLNFINFKTSYTALYEIKYFICYDTLKIQISQIAPFCISGITQIFWNFRYFTNLVDLKHYNLISRCSWYE